MSQSNAQRQAAYRARRDQGEGERRVNTWISVCAYLALNRLAHRYGVTQKAMLEKLIVEADDAIFAGLELDSPEWTAYLAGADQPVTA